jgi:Tol biopolymer transport system component/DNA-binding winged helix-turn-helix (wHTH) protein
MHTSPRRIRFDSFELDLSSSELRKGPTRLKVPYQSLALLQALLERPGELVTRDELRHRLWPSNTFVDFNHGLNVAIRRLREALGDSADSPKFVETVPRRGYRFIGETVPTPSPPSVAGEAAADRANLSLPSPEVSTDRLAAPATANKSTERSRRAWTWRPLLAASVVVSIGVGVWVIGMLYRPDSVQRQAPVQIVPITSYPGLEVDPSLSPDGNRLAFAWEGESGDNLDIYVRSVDGGTPVALTKHRGAERAPVWSPDGRRIAFLREVGSGRSAVVVVPELPGGPERQLTEIAVIRFIDPSLATNWLAWLPSSDSVVFADEESPSSGSRIFMCSVEACERWQLTRPGPTFDDIAPALSPSGHQLAFVRRGSGARLGQVFVQDLVGPRPVGEPRAVTSEQRTSSVTWSHDGKSLIYARGDSAQPGLWRVPLEGGEPEPILTNVRASRPSIDRAGKRLVFQLTTTDMNIWRGPGPANDGARSGSAYQALISSTLWDSSPQFSSDGTRITFISFRTGAPEVWIARSDGTDQRPLTTIDGPAVGTPRWSPTGDEIAFDTTRYGGYNISVVNVKDGQVRDITNDRSTNLRPSWSGDGKWIYFSSGRSGERQLWKAPSSGGGEAIPITKQGGFEAFESPDGKHIYYVRADEKPENAGIWRVPVDTGAEVRVVGQGGRSSFAVTKNGIFIVDPLAKPSATFSFYSFASPGLRPTGQLPAGSRMAPSKIAVSPDEKWILYVQYDQWGSDIQMIEGSW